MVGRVRDQVPDRAGAGRRRGEGGVGGGEGVLSDQRRAAMGATHQA